MFIIKMRSLKDYLSETDMKSLFMTKDSSWLSNPETGTKMSKSKRVKGVMTLNSGLSSL